MVGASPEFRPANGQLSNLKGNRFVLNFEDSLPVDSRLISGKNTGNFLQLDLKRQVGSSSQRPPNGQEDKCAPAPNGASIGKHIGFCN